MPFNQAKEKIFFFEENNWMDSNLNSLDYLQFVKVSWHSQHDIDTELSFWGIDQFAKVPIKKIFSRDETEINYRYILSQ